MSRQRAQRPLDYPVDVWRAAERKWDGMETSSQDALREELRARREEMVRAYASHASSGAFTESFSGYDFLWLFLALGTAWRFGAIPDGG